MKLSKLPTLLKNIFLELFPDAISYTLFVFMIVFTIITVHFASTKQLTNLLISAFFAIYCLVEYDKRVSNKAG